MRRSPVAPGGGSGRDAEVEAGAAVYGRFTLPLYDLVVVWLSNRWVWRCPAARLRGQYDRHVTARHLEVGAGTGYFLDRARWPGSPSITIADLNEQTLRWAAHRVRRHQVDTAVVNALEPFPDLPGAPFDSAGLGYLLHCVPGSLAEKAPAVFGNVAAVVAPGGVVFGSTILGPASATTGRARRVMKLWNDKGVFHNTEDSYADLEAALDGAFASHTLERVGEVALFTARTAVPAGQESAGNSLQM